MLKTTGKDQTRISIITAISQNYVIGKDNKLPWNIPQDLRRFRDLTKFHPVIMGRKTYESIGKPLPNRKNIVVTRDVNSFQIEKDVILLDNLTNSIEVAKEIDTDEIFIIGGSSIYKQSLGLVDRIYLTLIHKIYEGDSYFPDYSEFDVVVEKETHTHNSINYTFYTLDRGSA